MLWSLSALLLATTIVLAATCAWFILERRKKFALLGHFFSEPEHRLEIRHPGGTDVMRTVVLKAEYPFKALIGIGKAGFDPYAIVESNHKGMAMLATWFGPGPCLFLIRIDGVHPNHVKMEIYDGVAPECTTVCRPHWLQRFF